MIGEGDDLADAEEIFEEFKEHSVAEFFKKNRQMLGFSGKVRSLTTIVHEYTTNSLDACEEASILPNILIKVDQLENEHYKVTAEDNGPGIPRAHLGKALGMMLAGTKFHRYMQQRGQQGIGASGCTMFSQMTTGKPIKVRTGLGNGRVFECELAMDVKNNKPIIANEKEYMSNYRGLVVEAEFADVKYDRSDHGVFEYLKRTAIANPHAQLTLIEPTGERIVFPRASEKIPPRPREVQPHPLGITTNDLMEMAQHSKQRKVSSFLTTTFSRLSSAKVEELRQLVPNVNFDKQPFELKWEEAEALVRAFQNTKWIAPETDAIRPIGADQVEKALRNILNPQFVAVTERRPKVYRGGVPFIVEAALAYGGNAGKKNPDGSTGGDIIRYGNRAPLLFDGGGCAVTESVKTIDWRRYDIKDFENDPLSVFVNFVSVHVPYTGAGKQAIAIEDEIVEEIRFAVMEVARNMQRYLHGIVRDTEREAKKKAILRYVKQLSSDLPLLAGEGKPPELEKKLAHMVETKYKKVIEEANLKDLEGEVKEGGNGEGGEEGEKEEK